MSQNDLLGLLNTIAFCTSGLAQVLVFIFAVFYINKKMAIYVKKDENCIMFICCNKNNPYLKFASANCYVKNGLKKLHCPSTIVDDGLAVIVEKQAIGERFRFLTLKGEDTYGRRISRKFRL